MNKNLLSIFEYYEREKHVPKEMVIKSIEEALVLAAKRGKQVMNNVSVSIDPKSGDISVTAEKEIVENVEYPAEEISLEEARELDEESQTGDWIDVEIDPEEFGRIAAQVAHQVISQKLRNAEREVIYREYKDVIGQLVSGTVSRITSGGSLIVDLGKTDAILPRNFFPKSEKYHIGEKVLALLYDVQENDSGSTEIILSRSDSQFVAALFTQEVPEIAEGSVKIEKIVRDPGFRTKMAVSSTDSKVDPVGSCVGVRGIRVKNILRELNNEKIDILPFSKDNFLLLANALSPSEIKKSEFDDENNSLMLVVNDEQYPSVLGKKGNNIRLTSQLIGCPIEVHKMSEYQKKLTFKRRQIANADDPFLDKKLVSVEGVNQLMIDNMKSSDLDTPRKLLNASPQELAKFICVSIEDADDILEKIKIDVVNNIGVTEE